MLAEARDFTAVLEFKSIAQFAHTYAESKGDREEGNRHKENELRARRWLGEFLRDMNKAKGGQPSKNRSHHGTSSFPPTLADMGIKKNQSSRWQTEATLPEETFEQYVAETKAQEGELTAMAVRKLAKGLSMAVHFSSGTSVHCTPGNIIAATLACLGEIDLDPCSEGDEPPNIPAHAHYTVADDGLAHPWHGRIYMNPPYGQEIGDWVEKLCSEYEAKRANEAIALVPSRTDTQWWARLRDYPVCFVRGRLTFVGSENPAPFPSAVFYLGRDLDEFYHTFGCLGDIYGRLTLSDVVWRSSGDPEGEEFIAWS